MKNPIMTSWTREIIAFAEVKKISPEVLSVGLPRGRNEHKLIPYTAILSCNERAGLRVKEVAGGNFICLINGKLIDNDRHQSEAEARVHHWMSAVTKGRESNSTNASKKNRKPNTRSQKKTFIIA
jgi:hypothetical protein